MLTLPNYQIIEQIYESANSLVYRGQRKSDNQPVILKMLKQDYPTPAELTRYQQEYDIINSLDLSGVIKVYNIEKYQNTLVIILEDFDGASLKQLIVDRPLTIQEFLPIAIQIADNLANIHAANIIHKDINPSNIVVNVETKQLKIIDFGIASRLPRENPILKNPEQLEGTLAYLSPEQTGRINRSMDYRTDLYSLGVMFYEMLTGQLPFDSTDAMELVHCHIAKIPVPINEINPEIPQIISNIVMKLLAKNVENRYQSAFGLKSDLERCQENLTGLQDLSGLQFKLAKNDFSGRFQIPQKLYCRKNEVNTLLQAFERVNQGTTEMMLVAGYSGVGKTALVHEVHKPMTEKRGYFAGGKFDQFQKNIPYSAITQAFNKFCRYLLLENTETLANWKTKILTAVGNNGQIIIDVIPDLELVIGKQPPVAEVGSTEAINRFQLFYLNFIKVLCSKEHPFILFIDDLQWIDSASLTLLKAIMLDGEIQHLLIIGAYRDNEVNSSHPFVMAMDELQKNNVVINTITLTNLQLLDVNNLLQDTLQCETIQNLANLVYQKTQGNAFFTHQFLHTLYEEELLNFNQQQWQWNVQQIANKNITANVVELMANKINKLPEKTVAILQLAACIGNQFELSMLAVISELKQDETLERLQPAIIEGLIQPLDEKSQFKFLHDRVQQATYTLIADKQKQAIHLQIGNLLLKNTPANILEDKVFNIVGHFNHSIELLNEQAKLLDIAKLNLIACQKARKSMASQPALEYIQKAMALLPENFWQNQLTFQIYKERAEVEFVNSNYDMAEQFINEVIVHSTNMVDKVDMYYLLITMYCVKGELNKAVTTGRKALALFGIILPNEDEKEQASTQAMEQARKNLQGIQPDSILSWSDLSDTDSIMIVKLLVVLETPVYIIGDLSTYVYLVARAVNISVQQRGLVAEISKMYANYGLLIGDIYGDYVSGYKFGIMALKMAECYNSGAYICKTSILFGNFINPWSRPLNQAASIHIRGYQTGIEAGEYEFAGYNLYGYFVNLFSQGQNLAEIKNEIRRYLPLLEKINHQFATYFASGINYIINYLQGENIILEVFGQRISVQQLLTLANNMNTLLCPYHSNMSFAYYLLGNYKEATLQLENAKKYLNGVFGSTAYPEFFFHQALIASHNSTKEQLDESLEKFTTWTENCCPDNFEHKYLLIKAETLRINGGNDLEIMQLYEQARLSARNSGFIQNEALCNELAAKFYLAQNIETSAKIYISQAHYLYQQWGATAKVQQLEAKYPQLLTTTLSPNINTNSTVVSSNATRLQTSTVLDLDNIAKAAQILTGEIVLSKLLEKMMAIVIENAGAERGFLLLPKGEQWFIEAEGAVDKQEVTVLCSMPIDKYLPAAIISYVSRTKENVRLDNASQEGIYTENSYIQNHQTQSVLCFPIVYQQQLRAILYFENNLITGAFTPQRLKVLTMLSSQIAISLENSQVMANLDGKVKERTVQLNTKVEELTQTRHELIQSEKMASLGRLVAGFAHELNTPLGVAIGSASMLQRKAKQVNKLIEQEEVDVDELLAALESIDKGSDLTLSNLERAANLVTSFKRTAVDQTSDELQSFHVHRVVNDIITTLNSKFKKTEIAIQVNCPDNIRIKSLPGALEQLLTNLLMNSYTHGFNEGKDTGIIQLNVQLNEQQLHLEYSDNGKGIAFENLAKIFEPFFTTYRNHGGSGLGMYICYNIVTTQLHGTLTCESIVGEGVMFKIYYPVEVQ